MANTSKDNNNKHLIAFLVDHTNPEYFFNLIDEGEAPNVAKYILGEKLESGGYAKASISRNIITGFPSTSANTHTSILTGSFAGKNNLILGNYWNLIGKKPKFIQTDKAGLTSIKKFNYEYVNTEVKTIFEHIGDAASFHALNRGADFKLFTTKSLATTFLPLLIQVSRSKSPGNVTPIARPELWRNLFTKHLIKYLKKVKETGHLHKCIFIVFLLTDENGHKFTFNSPEYKEAIQVLDFCVGNIIEGIETGKGEHVPGLKELGYLDSIIWNIHTDHSGRKVFMDKLIEISTITQYELGLKFMDGNAFHENINPLKKLNGSNSSKDGGKYSNINGFTKTDGEIWHGWLADNASVPKQFAGFYGEEYMRNLKPKNEEVRHRPKTADIISYFLEHDYTQFVIIPEEKEPETYINNPDNFDMKLRTPLKIPREYVIKIFSKNGKGIVRRKLKEMKEGSSSAADILYSYEIELSDDFNKDPLDYDEEKTGLKYGEYYSHRVWLEKTFTSDLPDVFHRLFGFFDCIYAPNIVVTSALKYHFYSHYYPFEKIAEHPQSHDGLFLIESRVPVTFAGPGIKKGYEIKLGRNIDILPTLLKAMDVRFDPNMLDGEILEDIFEE